MWGILNLKKSLLVISKILRPFVNPCTADDKYSLLNRDKLTQPIQMQIFQKQKTFCEFFSAILKFKLNFEHFQKNMTLIANVFPKLRLGKPWLDKYLKSAVAQYPSTSNMVNALIANNHSGTFIILIDYCREFCVWKSRFWWYAKC